MNAAQQPHERSISRESARALVKLPDRVLAQVEAKLALHGEAVSSTLIADEVINSTASAFLAAGTAQLLTSSRPPLAEISLWGMMTCLSDPLSGYFGHLDAIGWKMIERGQRDTPQQTLMPGERTQPQLMSRVDKLAARRQLRRRSSSSPRRRHRSPRQRRTRRHDATRPQQLQEDLRRARRRC